MTEIAVVVATSNRADLLERLLEALRAQTLSRDRWELVICDDCSGDRTPVVLEAAVRRGDLPLSTLRTSAPAGPSVARDDAWRLTSAPLVAMTDDDCEPDPGWLEALLAANAREPDAVLQGMTEPRTADRALAGHPSARTQHVVRPGPFYQACNIAYPRRWLETVDGFDRSFGWGGEDADLAWRVIEAGAEVAWVPEARVEHAVNLLGPGEMLRLALVWGESMRVHARHRGLRSQLLWGIFWRASHQLLIQALLGAALARRHPAFLLLGWPYLKHLERRLDGSHEWAPVLVASDALELFSVMRGAAKHRVLVL